MRTINVKEHHITSSYSCYTARLSALPHKSVQSPRQNVISVTPREGLRSSPLSFGTFVFYPNTDIYIYIIRACVYMCVLNYIVRCRGVLYSFIMSYMHINL